MGHLKVQIFGVNIAANHPEKTRTIIFFKKFLRIPFLMPKNNLKYFIEENIKLICVEVLGIIK